MFKLNKKSNNMNFKNIPYPLYESSYSQEVPLEQLYILTFQCLPSKYINGKLYKKSLLNYFELIGFKLVTKSMHKERRIDSKFMYIQRLYQNHKTRMFVRTYDENDNKDVLLVEFLYDCSYSENIEDFIDFEKLKTFEVEKKKSNISLVKVDAGGHLDSEEFFLNVPSIDLALNYGGSFLKVHNLIEDRLNKDYDKGIILLHGDPGTGKTSYIKYLTSLIRTKNILFIPPSMAESLSEPSIIPFLMEYKNSILIIEDAEKVISDREFNGSSAGVSNILNLTDGILGDCLGIQIVATFNMKREKIDPALLRKGRLIAEHKFEKLNVNETNKLLEHLKKDFSSKESMCLADIYNIDSEYYKTEDKNGPIGFYGSN
jgi:hypothetical protein